MTKLITSGFLLKYEEYSLLNMLKVVNLSKL